MTGRERVLAALEHRKVDRVPRNLWALPGVFMFRNQEREAIVQRFPEDFTGPVIGLSGSRRWKGNPGEVGSYTDDWGCTFEVGQRGVVGEVKHPLLANDYEGLAEWDAPWECMENLRPDLVAEGYEKTDLFVLAGTHIRPFERMQFLRGTENLYLDIASGEPLMMELLAKLDKFYTAELEFWQQTPVDGVSMMDDWGSQRSLLINPKAWRKIFKPYYQKYAQMIKSSGKKVFFHSDGYIADILPDLIEIGVDAVNSQLFCMDMEEVGRQCAGKICFWGEIDRQHLLPFGTEEEVRQGVRRVYKALCPNGPTGVIAQCEMGLIDPPENVAAVFDEWNRISEEEA